VLLLEKVRNGEIGEGDYVRIKPHASDHLVTACESSNYQVEAMERMEFTVSMHSTMTPTVKYADIILPAQDWMWEEKNITRSSYGGFECINYCPGVVEPPGEVKPWLWVYGSA
jgi:anaerobic selenocysteine-containing dehydrogenase